MDINLRRAEEKDVEMINDIYRKINFKESEYENEKIVIAESNNIIVGLGRIQKINSTSLELGGIFVKEDYRGKGIANKIVSELVNISINSEYIYCIPFEHLSKFYKSFGFNDINISDNIPEKVLKKYMWCNEYYKERTILLVKMNKSST